jgi:ABC-2 type transport system ATP-binding protein
MMSNTSPELSPELSSVVSPATSAAKPIIAFRSVRKSFGHAVVLDGLSLSIPAGSIFALVGINGAGKTTTIKSLLDFSSIDAGEIEIAGRPHRESAARAPLYFLPERFVPPAFLSGEGFLAHSAQLHGASRKPGDWLAVVNSLELDPQALARPVREYSKGMVQKLGLAAAFASGKPLLVLDEPMSGLDPKARILVKRRLGAEKAAGRTLFLTTHMLADVTALCDEMAILHAGRVAYSGTPRGCLERFGCDDLEAAFLACIESAPIPDA